MTDNYKNGLITGLSMQPLYVTTGSKPTEQTDNYCSVTAIIGILTDDCYCRDIEF